MSPYQYFKNRNGIFRELKLNLRREQWSNILIWQLFENLPKIKYFLAYVYRSIGPTSKIILSVQDNFCRTFATVRRTFGMTVKGIQTNLIICSGTCHSNYLTIKTTETPIKASRNMWPYLEFCFLSGFKRI